MLSNKKHFQMVISREKWLLIPRNFIPDSYSWMTIIWVKLFSSNSTNIYIFISLHKIENVKLQTLSLQYKWSKNM